MQLSQLANGLTPSPTRAFDKLARELAASGKNVLFFTLGEPDFPSPKNVKRAAITAIKEDFTHYTAVAGIPELRKAIANKFQRDNNLAYSSDQILVSAGAANSLYLAFQCLLNPGDEAIVPVPGWSTVFSQIKTTGAVPVFVQCKEENDFEVQFEDIQRAITPKTKLIAINFPCNPTGAVIPEKTIKQIVELCREKNLWLISDEIYEKITYGQKHVSPALLYENTVTINGASKAYAMTGWRIGYAAAPVELATAMTSLQGLVLGNPTSISQKAALEALNGSSSQGSVSKMKKEFRNRRDLIVKLLNEIPGLHVNIPKGAFYAFANVSGLFGKKTPSAGKTLSNSVDVSSYFLNEALVATTPGQPFGSDSHVRFSYACSQEQINEGMTRLKVAVEKLK